VRLRDHHYEGTCARLGASDRDKARGQLFFDRRWPLDKRIVALKNKSLTLGMLKQTFSCIGPQSAPDHAVAQHIE
jgi:hypothetical protein